MNFNTSFARKVAYISAIALLVFPLFSLGHPSSETDDQVGGKLAQLRLDHGLSQAALGDLDPASETMRMATLGLRGVAASMLWSKANNYKKTEDWDNLSATLNQIAKLQPNFISVWEFQAHNLSYNVSVEFDDYRHRYHWVKEGIEFLMDGTRYNSTDSRLLWNLGWFSGHKIGSADEHTQFRRLFSEDQDFHARMNPYIEIDAARGMNGKPDNWRVAYLWFVKSGEVDRVGVPITWFREDLSVRGLTEKRRSPVIFHSDPGMSLINYAEAAEEDGFLDEKAQRAWMEAGEEWAAFGDRLLPTTYGHDIRLNDFDAERLDVIRLRKTLDALVPGVREEIRKGKLEKLTQTELEAYLTPSDQRTPAQNGTVYDVLGRVRVEDAEVAAQTPAAVQEEVQRVLARLESHRQMASRIAGYRQIVNYYYWGTRCSIEQTQLAISAHKHVHDGLRDFQQADLLAAKENFEKAWQEWAEIFRTHPALLHDVTAESLVESIRQYRVLLGQLDEPFPKDFVLDPLLEAQGQLLAPQHFEVMAMSEAESAEIRTAPVEPADAPPKEQPPQAGEAPDQKQGQADDAAAAESAKPGESS